MNESLPDRFRRIPHNILKRVFELAAGKSPINTAHAEFQERSVYHPRRLQEMENGCSRHVVDLEVNHV